MGLFDLFKKKPPAQVGEEGVGELVPRLKTQAFVDSLTTMQIPELDMPVTEPYVGDLVVAYAFDSPTMFRMATRRDLTRLNLTLDEARGHARQNLFTIVGNTELPMQKNPPGIFEIA